MDAAGFPRALRDGRYEVGRPLGEGGMAAVFVARDRELGVDRAVKLISPSGATRDTLRRRLRSEARAMARLNHPHILSVHDVGSEGAFDWVVMDLATGGSLQDLVQRGPVPPAIAARAMEQVLSALDAAHAAGVVHRDVKPHNVLLDQDGRALLADFGIARLADDDRRTQSGVAMGSLAFMPPEQRLDAARVGPAADLYAVGSTLYNLLTGANPVDLFLATPDSPRWNGVPDALRPIVQRAVRMAPDERYPSARAMADALREAWPDLEPVPSGWRPDLASQTGAPTDHGTVTAAPSEPAAGGPGSPEHAPVTLPTATPTGSSTEARTVPGVRWAAAVGLGLALIAGVALWPRATPVEPAPIPSAPPSELDPGPGTAPLREEHAAPAPTRAGRPAARSPVGGRWTGSLGGIVAELTLTGPNDALTGALVSRFGQTEQRVALAGQFEDPRLTLVDTDRSAPSTARYDLSLTADGRRLEGRVTRDAGGVRTLVLQRVP